MSYMENQMDNLIEASQHQYEEFCQKTHAEIQAFISEKGYTWTVESIIKEYREKYSKGIYVSHTAKIIIEKFKQQLSKL